MKKAQRAEEENSILQEVQTQDRMRMRDLLRRYDSHYDKLMISNQDLEKEKHMMFDKVQSDMSAYEAELMKFENIMSSKSPKKLTK